MKCQYIYDTSKTKLHGFIDCYLTFQVISKIKWKQLFVWLRLATEATSTLTVITSRSILKKGYRRVVSMKPLSMIAIASIYSIVHATLASFFALDFNWQLVGSNGDKKIEKIRLVFLKQVFFAKKKYSSLKRKD